MKRIITIVSMMMLLLVVLVSAAVSNESISTSTVTNDNTMDIFLQTDDPKFDAFRTPTTYVDLEFDGSSEINCSISGATYNCSQSGIDISGKEGTYQINISDGSSTANIANVTIDHSVTANDFAFVASANEVSYTDGCVDSISGVNTSLAQYSNDSFVADVNNFTGSPQNLTNGTVYLRGYCKDQAGNEAYTGTTSYVLPASPPDLVTVTYMPSTTICAGGFPCDYDIDGSGTPVDVSLKLTFDKIANISASMNGGTAAVSDGYYLEHVLSFDDLRDGEHELTINATDGTNEESFVIDLNVTNTGGVGNISIDIRGSIAVTPPVVEFVDFTGTPSVLRDDVFPGEWAIVKYRVYMLVYEWTRFRFDTASSTFDAPVQVFCEDDYNTTTKDLVDGGSSYNISTFNVGTYDETQSAINCTGTGNLSTGYEYDVYVKYPIAANATPGSIAGQFSVGLYNSSS